MFFALCPLVPVSLESAFLIVPLIFSFIYLDTHTKDQTESECLDIYQDDGRKSQSGWRTHTITDQTTNKKTRHQTTHSFTKADSDINRFKIQFIVCFTKSIG